MMNGSQAFKFLSEMTEEQRLQTAIVWCMDHENLGSHIEALKNRYDDNPAKRKALDELSKNSAAISDAIASADFGPDFEDECWEVLNDALDEEADWLVENPAGAALPKQP